MKKEKSKRFALCPDCADDMSEAYRLTVIKGNCRVQCDGCGKTRWGSVYECEKKEKNKC